MTGSDIIAPHKTNMQASPTLSDMFAHLERELSQFQSAIQTPKARAAALATAYQDIDAAERFVLSMRTRRNMLVPICILPAEILARIFHFTAFSEQPYSPTPALGWVYVTHVCQRWRQVALDDSTLWTYFSTFPRNKDWIAERLSRARNAPLVINLGGTVGKETFSLFTPHISHTRELYVYNLSLLHSEVVQGISIQKAPALERLELCGPNTSPMGIKHLVGHSFFKGPLPKLRIFCVSQIFFPWSLIPRDRLAQLKITLNKEVFTSDPEVSPHDDLNQMIDLLVNCPALEVLTLENCLPATLSESSGVQTIHLPRLSRLCLGGSSSRVTNLLNMLKFPSSTTLRLTCTSENTATHIGHLILPLLSDHFNSPTSVKFRSFQIKLDHVDGVIDMVASTSLPISPIPHTHIIQDDSDAKLSLSFQGVVELNNRMDILRRACAMLPLSNVEFLSMHSPSPNHFIKIWSETFQHCTEITTVQVHGGGTIGLLQALTPSKRANTTARGKGRMRTPVRVPIFPKLTSLVLERLDFTDAVPGSGVLFDLVMSAVQRREAKKTPLRTLCIDFCTISVEEAGELKKVVHDFWWDHDERGAEDEDEDNDDYDYVYDYDGFGYDDDHSDISDRGARWGDVYGGCSVRNGRGPE